MARPVSDYPTELELQLLKILWEKSPLLVREIRKSLAEQGRDIAHTSVITTLNTMVDKKTLKRTKQGKAFLYTPRVKREKVSQQMLADVVDRVFDGSPSAMVLNLLETTDIDSEELAELRKLISRKAKEQSK